MAQSARKKVSGERGLPKNQCFFVDKIMQYHEKNEKNETSVVIACTYAIILSMKKNSDEVHYIGKLDKDIYRCITEDMVTDDVIITDERIGHIKERHPSDYERYYYYLREIIEQPDYIVETNKLNTALILKAFKEKEEQFKTVLRLTTSCDNPDFSNSIITFMKINEKEWNRMIRNREILYKRV